MFLLVKQRWCQSSQLHNGAYSVFAACWVLNFFLLFVLIIFASSFTHFHLNLFNLSLYRLLFLYFYFQRVLCRISLFEHKLRARSFRLGIHFSELSTCGLFMELLKSILFHRFKVRSLRNVAIVLNGINFVRKMIYPTPIFFACVKDFGSVSVRTANRVNSQITCKTLLRIILGGSLINLNENLFASGGKLFFNWFFHHYVESVTQVLEICCVCKLFGWFFIWVKISVFVHHAN